MGRLRNNPASQALADNAAREDGCFFFADYMGIHEGRLVYVATHEDSLPRCEGFPVLIYVDAKGNVTESVGDESLHVLCSMRRRDYRRGREIFRRYKSFQEVGCERPRFEQEYWDEVVSMVEGRGYDVPVDATVVYRFLEAAERLGLRLEFRPVPDTMACRDACEYYVALVGKENCYLNEFHKRNEEGCRRNLEAWSHQPLSVEDVLRQSRNNGRTTIRMISLEDIRNNKH